MLQQTDADLQAALFLQYEEALSARVQRAGHQKGSKAGRQAPATNDLLQLFEETCPGA